jgi:hyperosmotically inducible protein
MKPGVRALAWLFAVVFVAAASAACGKTVGDTIDDATITTRVKTALLNDPDIGALRIDVSTSLGVVTLDGTVKTEAEKGRAADLARTVPGVKDVKVNLQVGGAGSSQVAGLRSEVVCRRSGAARRESASLAA